MTVASSIFEWNLYLFSIEIFKYAIFSEFKTRDQRTKKLIRSITKGALSAGRMNDLGPDASLRNWMVVLGHDLSWIYYLNHDVTVKDLTFWKICHEMKRGLKILIESQHSIDLFFLLRTNDHKLFQWLMGKVISGKFLELGKKNSISHEL